MERLEQQINFILEVDKIKNIYRQTYLADGSRKENDAEHSWHLALMCAILGEYSNEKIEIGKTIIMLLIHDLVEIDAGDTYAYDDVGNTSKREREIAAAERIFNLLPIEQANELRALWEEFELMNTPEAKFAHSMDKLQPILLNTASNGRSWREHGIKETQIEKRNANTKDGSVELWEYTMKTIQENVNKGNLIKG